MTDLENPAAIVLVGDKGRQVYEEMRYGKAMPCELDDFDCEAYEEYLHTILDSTKVMTPIEGWDKDDD